MVDERQLEAALPEVAGTGLPLLVHAELAGPIERAMAGLGEEADWRRYATYLASRPDEAEMEAIRLLLRALPSVPVPVTYCASFDGAGIAPSCGRRRRRGCR